MEEAAWKAMQESLPRPMVVPAEYGFVRGPQVQGCASLDELRSHLWEEETELLVWTPDSPELQVPEEVPALFEHIAGRLRKSSRKSAILCLLLFTTSLILLVLVKDPDYRSLLRFLTCLFGLYAGSRLHGFFTARSLTPAKLAEAVPWRWYRAWLRCQKPFFTRILVGCISAVAVFQLFAPDDGIPAAGLVKDLPRQGEWWRLITAPMMHVRPLHFFMNMSALLVAARITEAHIDRRWLPSIFAFTALSGSLFSLALLPQTSVGASGGILGLFGFLTALAYRAENQFPPGFFKSLLLSIGFTASIGLFGFDFIDNPAHAGGLLGGLLMGSLPLPWILSPAPENPERLWPDGLAFAPVVGYALTAIVAILAGS